MRQPKESYLNRHAPPLWRDATNYENRREQRPASNPIFELNTDLGNVDCLSEIPSLGDFDEVFRQAIKVELPSGICHILDIDSLIRAKEAMNREHDEITVGHMGKSRDESGRTDI